ncbi:DUF6934 family protein [Dyadobacter pollutisoli]|jgi:hypothetical protein|uniref:Uncharacterized protein n=1 Tax=Dyadobacter pollutisoli TaxID=2910158 RepID=A0A9E8N518_9BACT|nr:hypothetical protein [Dyadobacter pollutisoli]WAC09413.1 hypothetical protein ON006_16815 [Dyadobacter pollutisoli]
MNKESYSYRKSGDANLYFFVSEGTYGNITKSVSITRILSEFTNLPGQEIYNLAFGDFKIINGQWMIDDSSRSNNGDMPKVIATVAKVAIEFMHKNETAILSFSGFMDKKSFELGRNQRTNLYQRAINSNFEELCKSFEIIGVVKDHIEEYVLGTKYDRILIKCKK